MLVPVLKLSHRESRDYWEVPVLFASARLLAVDKPSGLPAVPDPGDPGPPNLLGLLHEGIRRGAPWAQAHGLGYLASAHRLDPETSGVFLLARDKPTLHRVGDLLGTGTVRQEYLALAAGSTAEDAFEVDARLGPHPSQPGRVRLDPNGGKPARTRFEVLERFAGYTLLRCLPGSSRRHQVRVHARSRGLPLVGDTLYGGRPLLLSALKPGYRFKPGAAERPLLGRVALHAAGLSLDLGAPEGRVEIAAPWPKDFAVAVKYLRRFAPAAAGSPRDTAQ